MVLDGRTVPLRFVVTPVVVLRLFLYLLPFGRHEPARKGVAEPVRLPVRTRPVAHGVFLWALQLLLHCLPLDVPYSVSPTLPVTEGPGHSPVVPIYYPWG